MKNKKFIVSFLAVLFSVSSVNAQELPPLPQGPLILTSVTPEQLNPEYWIRKLPEPDKPIKSPDELKEFNKHIRRMIPERMDVLDMEKTRAGKPIRDQIELEYNTLRKRKFFGVDGGVVPKSIFENLEPLIRTGSVPDRIKVRWGVAVRWATVRALPTDVAMLEEPGDVEFDQLQFTHVKLWTPIAVLHASSDGSWFYAQSPYSRGWMKARDIAFFPDKETLEKYAGQKDFLVITGESVPVFSDAGMSQVVQRPSMGTVLPIAYPGREGNAFLVWMPARRGDGTATLQKHYIPASADVSVGYPPFTQANIIRQAFKLLGARYGWGGAYGGRDCSGFTHDVYLSLGVDMPRNSKEQAFVGTQLGHFEPYKDGEAKVQAIRAGMPANTLIRMPLHIMLFLGEDRGHFFVIHSTWAERISMTSDEKNRINQVVLSDMSLNGKSYLGSLFDRVISVNEVN